MAFQLSFTKEFMVHHPQNLIETLKQSILENHDCTATHLQSVWVEEISTDKTLWAGQVEIFGIQGHAKATIAYGWWQEGSKAGLVTILALTPTMDARKAIQAYLMSQDEPG
jgi:hypothetical protein